jgi:hypothetical protein
MCRISYIMSYFPVLKGFYKKMEISLISVVVFIGLGIVDLEDISVRHTKVEDLPGCRIKFYVYLELEVVTQEGSSSLR